MSPRISNLIITYSGVDGACAAALALLKYPRAEILVTSARRIDWTLSQLAGRKTLPSEIHICGVGGWCDREALAKAAQGLRDKGTAIIWHCGRRYLDEDQAFLADFCTPTFHACKTNTEAVRRTLHLDAHNTTVFTLLAIAAADP